VAIARALASDPAVLLADEPTGNLDEALTGELLDVLAAVCDAGTTVLVATHDRSVLERTSWTRQLVLRRGVLIEDLERAGTSRTGDLQAIGEVA
jgi:cell division transport system ATP-binding protein